MHYSILVSYILCDTHLHNYDRQNEHTLVKDDHIATALVTEVSAHRPTKLMVLNSGRTHQTSDTTNSRWRYGTINGSTMST